MLKSFEVKEEYTSLPVLYHDSLVMPTVTHAFQVKGNANVNAVLSAEERDGLFVLLTPPGKKNVHPEWGTLCTLEQRSVEADGSSVIVTCSGVSQVFVTAVHHPDLLSTTADVVVPVIQDVEDGLDEQAYREEIAKALQINLSYADEPGVRDVNGLYAITDHHTFLYHVVAEFLPQIQQYKVLSFVTFSEKYICTLDYFLENNSLARRRQMIHDAVEKHINRHQQEYYLREEIKAIQDDLGDGSNEYPKRIKEAKLPIAIEEKLLKEADRLNKAAPGSPEAAILDNYLDICLSIPWKAKTKDKVDALSVKEKLDVDHYGLEKVKERIVEYVAAKQFNPGLKGQILCFVGAPGIGKTSIASSIADAMNRKYVRLSLGGVRDESDIRGHRKTYVAAMPGRIVNALIESKVNNPLILLDEIDKMTHDAHGDPTSAMLEVLDSEQNHTFRDHFVEMPIDLSSVMFVATANNFENIPKPLIDRMEMIFLDAYTPTEKLMIAKRHLVPKQLKKYGLNTAQLEITDDALNDCIAFYTKEAGVRQLERTVAKICRKAIMRLLDGKTQSVNIDSKDLTDLLGERKYLPDAVEKLDRVGVVNGLAYTEVGGTLLPVEAIAMTGKGGLKTTGSLGDVMKESTEIAYSYVRSVADRYGIATDFYEKKDVHIHFPDGATPKDGPSAGITTVTALVSALSGRPVRHDIAMTGEVNLHGQVLPIGGLKEKTMAAYTSGIKRVFVPFDNKKDIADIDKTVASKLKFTFVHTADEVLSAVLM